MSIVSMSIDNDHPSRPWGGRLLPAAVLVLATFAALGWSAAHRGGGCDCSSVPFGSHQPGFRRLTGPSALAPAHLPVSIRLSPAVGSPAGVYRSSRGALVLYGPRSSGGRFRFTAMRRPPGFGAPSLRVLAHTCGVCSDNRFVRLAPGVRGALLAGGNGPNSITWLERGLEMQVLGPGTTFSSERAIAVARPLAQANRA